MKKICFLISFFLIIVLCGCAGYREIDRGYLVTAIGFSKRNDKVVALIEAMSSTDVSEEKSERVVLSMEGENVKSAYKNLKNSLAKPLYFEQLGAVVIEKNETIDMEFLNEIPNLNFGVYVVQTDDVKGLFENSRPNVAIGYDIIGLIKNYNKENQSKVSSQLYKVQQNNRIPTVKLSYGRLVIENTGE